jgi:DNA polymerase-4
MSLPVRHIIHADLDAFYAAVEQLDNPELRGKPVLVGGRPEGRGVVATASYEARKFGVHSAMPMATAVRHCPQGIIVRPRFDRYRELSQQVMRVFRDITTVVEPLSLDEAFLDITEVVNPGGRPPLALALELKERVKAETALNISVGVGTTKSVAKIASDLQKPDGLVVVAPGDERAFLAPLAVRKLPGIGPKASQRLMRDGIETIGQLADQSPEWFQRRFGKRAEGIRLRAAGQDRDPVNTERVAKSISSETTFPEDIRDPAELYRQISRLSTKVTQQLERKDLQGKTVSVKLRLSDFTTFTRQNTLAHPTRSEDTIRETAWQLLSAQLTPQRAFRLLGVGVSGFGEVTDQPRQLELALGGG